MKRGFTLIELLVVVLIIGILAAVALPQYQKTLGRIEGRRLYVMFKNIKRAEEIYRLETGSFTKEFSELDIQYDFKDNGGNGWRYQMPMGISFSVINVLSTNEIIFARFVGSGQIRGFFSLSGTASSCTATNYKYGEYICEGFLEQPM